jgi:omega-6 fatty acid desaturase (delta-12 desaturase)
MLPAILQLVTGNIGLHHVHHLSPRIPNYNLQRAHHDNPIFHDVPTLTLWVGIRVLRLKLYDEERARLVSFSDARPRRRPPAARPENRARPRALDCDEGGPPG